MVSVKRVREQTRTAEAIQAQQEAPQGLPNGDTEMKEVDVVEEEEEPEPEKIIPVSATLLALLHTDTLPGLICMPS